MNCYEVEVKQQSDCCYYYPHQLKSGVAEEDCPCQRSMMVVVDSMARPPLRLLQLPRPPPPLLLLSKVSVVDGLVVQLLVDCWPPRLLGSLH